MANPMMRVAFNLCSRPLTLATFCADAALEQRPEDLDRTYDSHGMNDHDLVPGQKAKSRSLKQIFVHHDESRVVLKCSSDTKYRPRS